MQRCRILRKCSLGFYLNMICKIFIIWYQFKKKWWYFFVGEKMKVVNKNFVVRIYPSKADKNDKGEKIVSIDKIESHIGGYRFIFNKELEYINNFRRLLIQNGYEDKVIVNDSSCNVLLKMLRQDNLFLEKIESSCRQQSQRNVIQAFKNFHNLNLKSKYPQFKSKKHSKDTFRIINNNNNVRIQKDKYGFDKIKLANQGLVKFKTSKEYRNILRQASNPDDSSAKIKHVTIKKENGAYSVHLSGIYTVISVKAHWPLARWPLHSALAEYVDMQVLYCLLSVLAGIDHAAIAVIQSLLRADLFDLEHHVRHEVGMLVCQVVERCHVDLRHHQHVNRSLRRSVAEHSDLVVLVDHVRRDFAVREFAEDAVIHVSYPPFYLYKQPLYLRSNCILHGFIIQGPPEPRP